jgi:superfamily II DNA helicase RecQ
MKASQEFGTVVSFHLDKIKDRTEQQAVSDSISNLGADTTQTVFLFASPQVFVNHPVWRKLLDTIIQNKLLRFVAIDEIHLFVHFAHSFWQEFAWLKPYLFSKLQSRGSASRTTIPILFMTATCKKLFFRMSSYYLDSNSTPQTSSGRHLLECAIERLKSKSGIAADRLP